MLHIWLLSPAIVAANERIADHARGSREDLIGERLTNLRRHEWGLGNKLSHYVLNIFPCWILLRLLASERFSVHILSRVL